MPNSSVQKLEVTSPAFQDGKTIPMEYACDGDNISPALAWANVPPGVRSYAIIVEDPDIPIPRFLIPSWVHWIVYNIDPVNTSIPKGYLKNDAAENGSKTGMTSYRNMRYSGPCPPFGTHRYFFKVYALDRMLDLMPQKATRKNILKAMDGHIVAYGELVGTYTRQK